MVIKFLCASRKTPGQCHKNLVDVYGLDSMSRAQVGVWHRRFQGGDTSVKDKPRSGRPASVNTEANRTRLRANLDAVSQSRGLVKTLGSADQLSTKS